MAQTTVPEAPIGNQSQNIKQLIAQKITDKKRFFSIEVMPIAMDSGTQLNYTDLLEQPLFTSIPWLHDTNLRAENAGDAPSLQMATKLKPVTPVLSHITCTQLTEERLAAIVASDVRNIFALRGDTVSDDQPMKLAIDLVRALRRLADPQMTIAVAGYPQTHPDATSGPDDLQHLKEKIDAGADFIITQFCFSFEIIAEFIIACRAIGITSPILVGVFVPTSYPQLKRLLEICRVTIPGDQQQQYAALADDPIRFKEFAFANAYRFIEQLFNWDYEQIIGIHIYTFNQFQTVNQIVERFRQSFDG